jgi:hypothetical protein
MLRLHRRASDPDVYGHTVSLYACSEGAELMRNAARFTLRCFDADMQLVFGLEIGDRQHDTDNDDRDQNVIQTHLNSPQSQCLRELAALTWWVPFVATPSKQSREFRFIVCLQGESG